MPTYPYAQGAGAIAQTIGQLRKGFPGKVDAGYLQRFQIAPKNESYVLAVLRFLGLIDEEGAKVESAVSHFYETDDAKFEAGMESTMRSAYANLFDEMGDAALSADRATLVGWFRGSDKTTDLVGQRQATTFQALAATAGYGEMPLIRGRGAKKATSPTRNPAAKPTKKVAPAEAPPKGQSGSKSPKAAERVSSDLGVTVRIEVNLPANGDAVTYDAIFASIRKHLMS